MKHFLRPKRTESGFTLAEVIISLLLIGILSTAVFSGLNFLLRNYYKDWLVQHIRDYGEFFIDEISDDLQSANQINVISVNGFDRVSIWSQSGLLLPDILYTIEDPQDGILQNDKVIKHARFADVPYLNDNRIIRLAEFRCEPGDKMIGVPSTVSNSIWKVRMTIELEYKIQNGEYKIDQFRFHRRVFVTSQFFLGKPT